MNKNIKKWIIGLTAMLLLSTASAQEVETILVVKPETGDVEVTYCEVLEGGQLYCWQ